MSIEQAEIIQNETIPLELIYRESCHLATPTWRTRCFHCGKARSPEERVDVSKTSSVSLKFLLLFVLSMLLLLMSKASAAQEQAFVLDKFFAENARLNKADIDSVHRGRSSGDGPRFAYPGRSSLLSARFTLRPNRRVTCNQRTTSMHCANFRVISPFRNSAILQDPQTWPDSQLK